MGDDVQDVAGDDDIDERKALYAQTKSDLFTRQISNTESLDSAILTLSTAALGFTLTFVKRVAESGFTGACRRVAGDWLVVLWIVFGAAILCTVSSFVCGQKAIERQLEYAKEYYLNRHDSYLCKRNRPAEVTEHLNKFAAGFFLLGTLLTIIFFIIAFQAGS